MQPDPITREVTWRNRRFRVSRFPSYLVGVAAMLVFEVFRHLFAPRAANLSPAALQRWWAAQFSYFVLFLIFCAVVFLLPIRKFLSKPIFIASLCNLFASVMFFAFYFVTSDRLAQPGLARIGLGWIEWCFLSVAILWSFAFVYVLSAGARASR